MADYGGVGGGQSLRDALNRIMPMTGMGEWGAMFPPPTGADQPTAPVPLPQPRPPMPPGMPPNAFAPSSGIPQVPLQPPPGIQGGVPLQGQIAGQAGLQNQQISGGVRVPINPNTAVTAGGQYGQYGPGDYAARLGLSRTF